MTLQTFLLCLIYAVILTLALERFMGVFFEKRKTPFPVMVLSYLLLLVVQIAYNLWTYYTDPLLFYYSDTLMHYLSRDQFIDNNLVGISIFSLLMPFIISWNYESSVSKKISAIAVYYVLLNAIFGLTELLVELLNSYLLIHAGPIWEDVAGCLLLYLIAHLLRRFTNIRTREIPKPLFWVSALTTISLMIEMLSNSLGLWHIYYLSSLSSILGSILLVFYMYDSLSAIYEDKLKSALHSQEKEYYLSQCRLMQESLERMKSYRHDMKMHFVALKDYTANNQIAADYLNNLLGDIEKTEIYSDTGNIAFDSIINFKLKNAKEDHIKPEINIFVPSVLNIEIADIVTIVGNLLENALEAVAKVEEKIIKLTIQYSKGTLIIKVDNSFDGKVRYIKDKAGGEKRITTRKDGHQHGYGLKNIRKSVDKYNGHMNIAYTDNIFSVGLLLYTERINLTAS